MKKLINFMGVLILTLGSFCILGCESSRNQVLSVNESQVKLRSMQSRTYDTADKIKTLRVAMATLQDLGFVIDKADDVLGSVSATKLDRYAVRITVNVRPKGETQMLVRANAQYNLKAVEDPEPYQQFFAAFEKALFLGTHNVTVASGGGVPGFGEEQKTFTEAIKPESKSSSMDTVTKCSLCGTLGGSDSKWIVEGSKLTCLDCYAKMEASKEKAKESSIVY